MTHWAADLIGTRWERGAQGPDAFDCWSFVRFVLGQHYRIEVPAISVPTDLRSASRELASSEELHKWRQVDRMAEGQIVMMARKTVPVHIGLAVSDGRKLGVLHCAQPSGVLFQDEQGLRAAGWGRLTHYRHQSCS